ncbi:MAG TPA: DNA-3-methyladenine glycosylase [Desulfuromonadaceae bacterium]
MRSFYCRDTIEVAENLLGKYLFNHINGVERVGRIVEVEAYLGPHDLAAHSSRGLTDRTRLMYGPPGFAYVYLVYGLHWCMNVVTEPEGQASAVLLRAIEPVNNVEENTRGPGLLCKAMHIDGRINGLDLEGNIIYLASISETETVEIIKRTRIGVKYAGIWADKLLRFYIKGSNYISRK